MEVWRKYVLCIDSRSCRGFGIDMGGTQADALLMHNEEVLAQTTARIAKDVTSGVVTAFRGVLGEAGVVPDASRL